jgi:hypothetical protein
MVLPIAAPAANNGPGIYFLRFLFNLTVLTCFSGTFNPCGFGPLFGGTVLVSFVTITNNMFSDF